MVPSRKPFKGGGRQASRNRMMGKPGTRSSETIRRKKTRGRVFRRGSDDDRRRSFDRSPRRDSDSYGGRDFYKKRPRPGPKPKRGPWGGQSRKSYEENEKKFWREAPKSDKKQKPSRDKDDFERDSDEDFGEDDERGHHSISRRKKKKGGKKKKGRQDDDSDMTPDPTQSELEAAYASYEENKDLLYERTKIANSKRLTDREMLREIKDRDYKEYIANRKKAKMAMLEDDEKSEDYKSSEDTLETNSEMSGDEFLESDSDASAKGSNKNGPKLPKLPKKMDETDYKSRSNEKVPEKEWNDFLEKEIYDEGKGDHIDKSGETNGLEQKQISLEDKTKSEEDENINKKDDAECVRKRLTTLDNQWKWYRNVIKDVTDGNLMLPRDLPDEEDEVSDVEKWIVNEYKPPRPQDDAVSIIEDNTEIEDEDESCMSSSSSLDVNSQSEVTPYQKARKYYMEITSSQDSEINTTQPDSQMPEIVTDVFTSQPSEAKIAAPSSQMPEIVTDVFTSQPSEAKIAAPSSQMPEIVTDVFTSQPSEAKIAAPSSQMPEIVTDVLTSQSSEAKIAAPSSQSPDDIQHEQTKKSTTYVDSSTDENEDEDDEDGETFKCPETNEELQEEWGNFLSVYEQCTGKVPDLPEELPDEEDEMSDVEKWIVNEYKPPPPQVESTESSDESIVSPTEPVSLTQQEDATSQQDKHEFTPDPGFSEYLQRQEDDKDDDLNKCMYESYKITGTAEEFREENPELFSLKQLENTRRVPLQWHHFKELWNRFVDVVTKDPSKAFDEYDKIIEAKEKALREGVDLTKLLNLTSEPESAEEPKTEYDKTEKQLKSHWRKYMKEAAEDTQKGINETLSGENEEDYKVEDETSVELEKTYRTVLKLCDHPERFDMEKYEATLSKEEIDSLTTGDGIKYDKRFNPNAENEIQKKRSSKRAAISQKMWEYFVNLMRQRHEAELEKFLADQPQSVVIGDSPEEIKDLWQKFINHTNRAQELATGKVENEGMESLWASEHRARRPPPLMEDETPPPPPPNANRTFGWNNLQGRLDTLKKGVSMEQTTLSAPDETFDRSMSNRMEQVNESVGNKERSVRSGWSNFKEQMTNLSTYENQTPPVKEKPIPKRPYAEAEKNMVDYYYTKQFPAENNFNQSHHQDNYYTSYPQQEPSQHRNQFDYGKDYRRPSYGRNSYIRNVGDYRNEQFRQIKGSESWQYNPDVSQMTSTPFGPNRQPTNYDRNQVYDAQNSTKSRWQISSRENEENTPLGPPQGYKERGPLTQSNLPPLKSQDYNTPLVQGPHSNYSRPGGNAPYYPEQVKQNWPKEEQGFLEQQEPIKNIKQWRTGTRPLQQRQNQSWASERPNYNYSSYGAQYNQSGDFYGVGTQGKDCIHLTDPSAANQQRQQTPADFPSQRVKKMEPFDSNSNI